MTVEAIRGCGYRKVGGVYVVSSGPLALPCDRLPYTLHYCPVCGEGVKFTRGWQWLDWWKYARNHETQGGTGSETPTECRCPFKFACPVCEPGQFPQPYGVLWVGHEYTIEEFLEEACRQGVSKRIPGGDALIPRLPKALKPGTHVLLAYKSDPPVIFCEFPVARIEKLIWQKDATEATIQSLEKAGINPVIIPDGDKDHDPANDEKLTEGEQTLRQLGDLKNRIKR